MDTIEKVYCTGHDNNDALVSALASKNNCDPMAMAAMMNQNDYMNNPFAYLIWMIFAMRMWNNQDGNQGNAIQSQLDAMRSQISDNQNSSLVMDAIRGNANAITQLASSLNCDFNALNNAICCVRSGIQEVAGNVNFSAERVINAINLGDANLTSALQNCCCQTQQNIIKMGYENQLGQKDIVNQMQTGFSYTNTGLERATSNLGFQMSQDVKQNYSVYILNKQDITITDGKVISVGFPHLDLSTKPAMGQSQMVVDVTIEANSKTATYSIPENLSVTYAGDVVLSTDKQGLIAEVEQMKNTAEKILESVPKQKEVVDKTIVLLSELNPVYKEKKETEQRFSKIEESISRMESTVNNFINSFNNAKGNSNTAQ